MNLFERRFGKTAVMCLCASALVAMASGCGDIGYFLGAPVTRVVLDNNGEFDVNVTLFISDNSSVSEDDLHANGEKIQYTISPGGTQSFSRDCISLNAIQIDSAELQIIGGNGPTTSTEILRTDGDFHCRNTIHFRFDHSDIPVDFHVTTDVEPDPLNPTSP